MPRKPVFFTMASLLRAKGYNNEGFAAGILPTQACKDSIIESKTMQTCYEKEGMAADVTNSEAFKDINVEKDRV